MASALLQTLVPSGTREHVVIDSAGTHADPGSPASEPAVTVAAAKGLDLRDHRSRRLTREDLLAADLVLVMEAHHAALARRLAPERSDQIHLLSELEAAPDAVPEAILDPMGGSREIYEECLLRIERHLVRILPLLHERVAGEHRS